MNSGSNIKCIFCGLDKASSEEHVIPESVGGYLKTYDVCGDCNSSLGSEVDSILNKHRAIYDAYIKSDFKDSIPLKFNFIDSHFEYLDGTKVKATRSNIDRKIIPTKIGDKNSFIISADSDEWVEYNIRKRGERKGLSNELISRSIAKYLEYARNPSLDTPYVDLTLGFKVIERDKTVVPVNKMITMLPDRFVAKACVEFAYLNGIQDEIKGIEEIKEHALHGGAISNEMFVDQIEELQPNPIHVIAFHDSQFRVEFFSRYSVGINLEWIGESKTIINVNHLIDRCVYEGKIDGDKIGFFNIPLY